MGDQVGDGRNGKLFKDPVHGYISVPRGFCERFIDQPIFQRLRHIEQTSMRPLYPAARHDRFIHSLGVYHLGDIGITHVRRNSPPELLTPAEWDRMGSTFRIACLMHDCGHAPFSHTFEHFYNNSPSDNKGVKRAENWLKTVVKDECFVADFEGMTAPPAPHESFSAALLLQHYAKDIRDLDADPVLAARMITGCRIIDPSSSFYRVANCLIGLLNGKAIDVDKLDYIARDTWASGIRSTPVDVDRLLAALEIHGDDNNGCRLCFRPSALSVIQAVVDARNYHIEWIYNHHTVVYYAKLLDRMLTALADRYATHDNPGAFWDAVFSQEPFKQPVALLGGHRVYLPTDGDILYLLKTLAREPGFEDIDEILSHRPKRIPLWKTRAAFRHQIDSAKVPHVNLVNNRFESLPDRLSRLIGKVSPDSFMVIEAKAALAKIFPNEIMVRLGDELVSFDNLVVEKQGDDTHQTFYYVFVPRELEGRAAQLRTEVCRVLSA